MNERPWFANMANYKVASIIPNDFNWNQLKKFLHDACFYVWDDPYLFKIGADNLSRRCVTMEEAKSILWHCHKTIAKVLQARFFWPSSIFKDAHDHVLHCKTSWK